MLFLKIRTICRKSVDNLIVFHLRAGYRYTAADYQGGPRHWQHWLGNTTGHVHSAESWTHLRPIGFLSHKEGSGKLHGRKLQSCLVVHPSTCHGGSSWNHVRLSERGAYLLWPFLLRWIVYLQSRKCTRSRVILLVRNQVMGRDSFPSSCTLIIDRLSGLWVLWGWTESIQHSPCARITRWMKLGYCRSDNVSIASFNVRYGLNGTIEILVYSLV